MDLDSLSPASKALLLQAFSGGHLVNVLYQEGARVADGFNRESRCFALGKRGWLDFVGWEGAPAAGSDWLSRWALTDQAQALLSAR